MRGDRKRPRPSPLAQDLRLLTLWAPNVRLLAEYWLFLEAKALRRASSLKRLELAVRFAAFCEPRPLLKASTEDVVAWLDQADSTTTSAARRPHPIDDDDLHRALAGAPK